MTRIPEGPARRIDHLAWRAHAFHRYAHHPLCEPYRGEVLRAGRLRFCKGCTCAAAGALAGIALGCLLPALPIEALATLAIAMVAWIAAVFMAPWGRRLGKLGTRLLPALGASFLLSQGCRSGGTWGWGIAGMACLGVLGAIRIYRARGPWRAPCGGCSERVFRPCSGFRLQLRRERAFGRLAGRLLAGEGPVADHKTLPLD